MEDSRFTVGQADLPKLKSRIAKALPHMGRARTTEVLAAALGFKSYAALRAAISDNREAECRPLLHAEAVRAKLERFGDQDIERSVESVRRITADLAHWERMSRISSQSALSMALGIADDPESFLAAQKMAAAIRADGWNPESFAEHIRKHSREFGLDPEAGFRDLERQIEEDGRRLGARQH